MWNTAVGCERFLGEEGFEWRMSLYLIMANIYLSAKEMN